MIPPASKKRHRNVSSHISRMLVHGLHSGCQHRNEGQQRMYVRKNVDSSQIVKHPRSYRRLQLQQKIDTLQVKEHLLEKEIFQAEERLKNATRILETLLEMDSRMKQFKTKYNRQEPAQIHQEYDEL